MTDLLLQWATDQFWRAQQVNGHGITTEAVLQQVEKATGKPVLQAIKSTSCPACLRHIWGWFLLLLEIYGTGEDISLPGPGQWRIDLQALTGMMACPGEIQILAKLFALMRSEKKLLKE